MPRTVRRYAGRPGDPSDLRARSATEAIQIAWVTDSHTWAYVDEDPDHPQAVGVDGRKMFYQAGPKLRKVAAAINADPPHAVLHTGDLIERDDAVYTWPGTGTEFDYFREVFWDQIDGSIPKFYVPGNHDYSIIVDEGLNRQQTMAARMGETTLHAGGYFNKAVTLTGNGVTARLLLIDTNEGRDQVPVMGNGSLTPAQRAWLEDEFTNPVADTIVVASHHGFHDSRGTGDAWPDRDSRDWMRDLVATFLDENPDKHVLGLFGHRHVVRMDEYTNLDRWRGLLAPAILERNPSYWARLWIFADGTVHYETYTVQYP